MPLHELHARRLATVVTMVEGALERIELVLRKIENGGDADHTTPGFTAEQTHRVREKLGSIRALLKEAPERFSIHRRRPEARQVLAAELSTLWVILENAMPKRMKGYGLEFDLADKADWENLMKGLLREVEQIRRIAVAKGTRTEATKHPSAERG